MAPEEGNRLVSHRAALAAVLLFAAVYQLVTVAGRGAYWDEEVQRWYGKHVLAWFTSGFTDRSAMNQGDLIFYGGLVEAPLEALAAVLPLDPFVLRHVLIGFTGLACIYALYLLGRALSGPWTGVLAALLLAASPRFFGHTFFNSKDVPFAALYVLVLVFLVRDLRRALDTPLRAAVPLGVVLGMLMGTRIAGAIVCAPIALAFAAKWWSTGHTVRGLSRLTARFSVVFLVAWAVMLIAWPWAHLRPLLHPLAALTAAGRFPFGYDQLFEGRWVNSLELPLDYLPVWFVRGTPEIVLFGLAALLVSLLLRPAGLRKLGDPAVLGVAAGALVPLGYVMASRAALYDGLRHVMFLQPLIVLGAAVGIVQVARGLGRSRSAARMQRALVALVGIGVALPIGAMVVQHPLEYVYFNHASGGLGAAAGQFELDYWGLSYRAGVEWAAENLEEFEGRRIGSCSHPGSTSPFVSPPLRYVGTPIFGFADEPELLLYTALHDCVERPPADPPAGRVVHTIDRSGVTVLTLFEVESIPASWTPETERP